MKGYSLVNEHAKTYEVKGPDGNSFHVLKAHLDLPMHAQLAKLPKETAPHLDEGGAPEPQSFSDQGELAPDDGATKVTGFDNSFRNTLEQRMGMHPQADVPTPEPRTDPESIRGVMEQRMGMHPPDPTAGAPGDPRQDYVTNYGPTPGLDKMVNTGTPMEATPTGASLTYDQAHGADQHQQLGQSGLSYLQQFQKAQALEEAGIRQQAEARANTAKLQQAAYDNQVKQMQAVQENYKTKYAELDQQNKQLTDAVMNNKIDPSRYMDNTSTLNKIGMVLAATLGGAGAGLARQPNMALQVIQDNISRDIDAQKANLGTQKSLLAMNMQKYHNLDQATMATTMQLNAMVQGQIQAAAAKYGGDEAKGNANYLIGHLQTASIPLQQQMAVQQAGLNALNSQPQSNQNGLDMNRFNALVNSGFMDKKDATKELGDYQGLKRHLDWTDDVFNQARQKATILGNANPLSQDNRQYNSVVNSYLDKLTKDTEGRVTPTTLENIHSSMPTALDSDDTFSQKLNNVKDMLKSEHSFPNMSRYNLISPHDPVTSTSATIRSKVEAGTKK